MKAFGGLALALVCATSAAPRTVAQTFTPGQCTGTSRPDVRLDLRDPEVHFQPGVSVATLTAQQRTITDYQNQANSTNGVTRYRVTASYDAQLRMMLANGACIAPTLLRLRAEITSPITVIIGNDYPTTSCAYRIIKEHEMQHVTITTRHMRSIAHVIREKLQEHLTNRFYSGATPQLAQTAFYRDMQVFLDGAVRYADQVLKAQNAVIDSQESYQRMEQRCSDWVRPPQSP